MDVSKSDPGARGRAAAETAPVDHEALPRQRDPSSSFVQVLRGLGHEIGVGEATMRAAIESMRGAGDLGPARLIALQAGVYRYSEAIDLASRLVDRATGGVKTIVQGGGQ